MTTPDFRCRDKSDAKPILEICGCKIGGGFHIRPKLPDSALEHIDGFASEAEANRWKRNESKVWLHEGRRKAAN
jgi:hypothetical protein